MTFAVACVAIAASAQVYVGGSVGVSNSKMGDADEVTTYQFLPEVGFNLDENWAIGTVIGWGKGNPVDIVAAGTENNYFQIN